MKLSNETLFLGGLALAIAAIVYGISMLSVPVAWITGGILSAFVLWLIFAEVEE